jgi:hypothetical protein
VIGESRDRVGVDDLFWHLRRRCSPGRWIRRRMYVPFLVLGSHCRDEEADLVFLAEDGAAAGGFGGRSQTCYTCGGVRRIFRYYPYPPGSGLLTRLPL